MFNQTQARQIPLEYMSNQQLRDTLCDAAMKCVNALSAYAKSKDNVILLHQVGYSNSTLKKLKRVELESICRMIHDEAVKQISEAGAFGYSMEDVKALESRIQVFNSLAYCRNTVLKSKENMDEVMQNYWVMKNKAA